MSINNILKLASRYERVLKEAATPGFRPPANVGSDFGVYDVPDAYDAKGNKLPLDPSYFFRTQKNTRDIAPSAESEASSLHEDDSGVHAGSASQMGAPSYGPTKADRGNEPPPVKPIPYSSDVVDVQINLGRSGYGARNVTAPGQESFRDPKTGNNTYLPVDGKLGKETMKALDEFKKDYPQYRDLPVGKKLFDAVRKELAK